MFNHIPNDKPNFISVIELSSLTSDLVSSSHFFRQHYIYDKFLASRTKISESMRRANILKRLDDDAAFRY